MRRIADHLLWVGNVGDVRDLGRIHAADIRVLVDLAMSERPAIPSRELVYCRFPLLDGSGNSPWVLRAAVAAVAGFLRASVPTLVFCGAGMSRSPAVAALALSQAFGQSAGECLDLIVGTGPMDVSAGLWRDLIAATDEGFGAEGSI